MMSEKSIFHAYKIKQFQRFFLEKDTPLLIGPNFDNS